MAEFDYYGTTINDNLEIISHILSNTDLSFIPDIYYKTENDVIFAREIDDNIKSLVGSIGLFHFWSKRFYPKFPLSFTVMNCKGYEGLLSFHASPSLSFLVSRNLKNQDNSGFTRIGSGCLYHTRELYNSETNGIINIPQSVKDEHKKVVKLMKEKLIKVKNKNLWMGKEAFELFDEGKLEVIYKGEWINNSKIVKN